MALCVHPTTIGNYFDSIGYVLARAGEDLCDEDGPVLTLNKIDDMMEKLAEAQKTFVEQMFYLGGLREEMRAKQAVKLPAKKKKKKR